MKVVIAGRSGHGGESFVNELKVAHPDVDFQVTDTADEQMRHIKDADVFYGWPSREVFLAAERLRWIQCPGTGIDEIAKVPELIDSDVVLTNSRGPHATPMADHVIGMMIILAHRWNELMRDQRAHRWDPSRYSDRYVELAGRTLGILAFGDIGEAVARRAHGFGMEVYAVDKNPKPPIPEAREVWGLERLDDLLPISDWFVVTAPLTAESRGMIDRRRIGLLKEGARIIVISRGHIVDEDALVDALRSGRLAGAGLDAVANEPLAEDSPLWDMDNVVITPHASAFTPEMYDGRKQIFKENLRRFLANEPVLYTCDKRTGF